MTPQVQRTSAPVPTLPAGVGAAQPCRICGQRQDDSFDMCGDCMDQGVEAQTMAALDAYHAEEEERETARWVAWRVDHVTRAQQAHLTSEARLACLGLLGFQMLKLEAVLRHLTHQEEEQEHLWTLDMDIRYLQQHRLDAALQFKSQLEHTQPMTREQRHELLQQLAGRRTDVQMELQRLSAVCEGHRLALALN